MADLSGSIIIEHVTFAGLINHDVPLVTIQNGAGETILTIEQDGQITWPRGYKIDESAKAFERLLAGVLHSRSAAQLKHLMEETRKQILVS